MKRNKLLNIAAAAAVAGVLAIASLGNALAADKPLEGVNLRVGTWGGSWVKVHQKYLQPQMEALGATVTYVKASPQLNMAKLIAARGSDTPIDVMEVSADIVPEMRMAGFLQPIDYSLLPNIKNTSKGLHTGDLVATWVTQEGICYNDVKLKELGIPAPTKYADLGHPKLEGRIQIPDIVSGGGRPAVAGFAYSYGGNMKNVSPGIKAIANLKALKFWKRGAEVLTQIKSGDIYAAVIHAGWCVRAANAGLTVAMAHPIIDAESTGIVKQGWMGVIKGTKNAKAAHTYLNLFISAAFMEPLAISRGVVPENLNALKNLTSDPTLKKMMILDPAMIAKMLRPNFGEADMSVWHDEWNRSVSR